MNTTVKVIIYLAFMVAVYCEEYDVPVMMYAKRARFLAEWKMAATMQRRAMKSYMSYQEEAESVRG